MRSSIISLKSRRFAVLQKSYKKWLRYLFGKIPVPIFSLAIILIFFAVSFAELLPVKTYTVADGLLRDNVYRIKQDSRGFLWFCTAEGVSRFDGYGFTNFTTADGLPERHVNDFLETRSGAIYVTTNAGLARLNPQGVAKSMDNPLFTVILPDNERAKVFQTLFEDENGTIWAGTMNGLYQLNDNDTLEAVDLGKSPFGIGEIQINTIIKDRRGAMWIGTQESGLLRILPSGEVERFATENGLPDAHISTLHEDKNGRMWVGLSPHNASGLLLLVTEPHENQNIVERFYTMKDGLPSGWITDFYEDTDKFWIGTTRGLCEWQESENSVCKTYTSANDLCDTEIWTITPDKDKNLWIGTRCGLKKLTRDGFTSYIEPNGTVNPAVNSIFENAAGELFASYNDGDVRTVSRFDGEKFDYIKPRFPPEIRYFGSGDRQTVWQDGAGDWWFPTGNGLYQFSHPNQFADLAKTMPRKISPNPEITEIIRLFEDSSGNFWISAIHTVRKQTMFELWMWEKTANNWRNLTQETAIGKNRLAVSFVEDQSGNVWIGTGSDEGQTALIRYHNERFDIFTKADNELITSWINDLFVDDKGRLWIADNANGVLRLDDVNAERLDFVRYTPAEGLSSIGVSCITEDEFGRIYIGTGRGLDRLDPETGQVENFTTADGLPNSHIDISYRDKKNNLWFGTSNGLARYIPAPEHERKPPNVLITNLRVNGESENISMLGVSAIPLLELSSDQKQISVNFLGLGASLGEKMKYEYRFSDSDWTTTNERTVNFANLGSGEYKFEVRAQTADRIYSQPATVSFRIAAPIWQRPWFIVLAAVLVSLAVYFIYRNRLKRLLEMERMRTRIATDLHDDIGANLTRIALLSEVANQQAVNGSGNLMTSIAGIARESVASMNDIVWAIAPEHDSLLDLTRRMRSFAEEIFASREIDLSFDAPSADTDLKLSVGVRRDVLLIFKEAVNNAARHSDCSQVAIDFRVENAKLLLQIKDNGVGFAADIENDGQGLRSMSRRARALGGDLTIESSSGTTVKFELVLAKNNQV
jgi:ligand-binding sensor domain-containing protein/two-component sensor histidine kinase